VLQAIATENNLSETAFVLIRPPPLPLGWFTPKIEVDLCGHATLASASVLLRHYFPAQNQVIFTTRSGELTVARKDGQLAMDLPARPGQAISVSDQMIAALGAEPAEAYLARDLLTIFSAESESRISEAESCSRC